jgi:hypothetical protein
MAALFVVHVPVERGEEGVKESANAKVRTPSDQIEAF